MDDTVINVDVDVAKSLNFDLPTLRTVSTT